MRPCGAEALHLPQELEDDLFGVACSATGRRWRSRAVDARLALALAQRLGAPEIVGRVLAGRGVGLDEASGFLEPTLRETLPDPSRLAGMDAGATRLARAIVDDEPVAVFADYDVDGATSAALLARFLATAGRSVRVYVPDRLGEGYGPSAEAMRTLRAEGIAVVVTVDCGTTAFDALEAAAEAGLDVIVVDHHAAEPWLPKATAVINPNRLDDHSGQGRLAAVGVAFLLVVAVNRLLRAQGFYAARPEPDLWRWLDLVALGTVCDLAPLVGVNRALVSQGLKVMARWGNQGLKALADVGGADAAPDTYLAGFVLGPRVNAAGRVGEAGLGARLLACDDADDAVDMAMRLDRANRARREIEAAVMKEALARVAAEGEVSAAPMLLVADPEWHPGVIGIVAGRLADRFGRPSCVVAVRNGVGTGSGRSVLGIDLGAAVIAARQAGIVVRGGGHAMAAGFTVEAGRLDELRAFLADRIADAVRAGKGAAELVVDGSLSLSGASVDLSLALARLAPFGVGNPEPRFAVAAVVAGFVDVVGDGHVRARLSDAAGARLEAIAFRAAGTPLGDALLRRDGAPLHIAGRLRESRWGGRSKAQMVIDDAAPALQRPCP